jgi:hypothetical protein
MGQAKQNRGGGAMVSVAILAFSADSVPATESRFEACCYAALA